MIKNISFGYAKPNLHRRNTLKMGLSAWIAPAINVVSLPAHAQISVCTERSLVGTWRFISATHIVSALHPTFELRADGSTSDYDSFWDVIDNQLILRQDVSDFVFIAEVTANCSYLSGTSTTIFSFPPFNLPAEGTWSAEKISP